MLYLIYQPKKDLCSNNIDRPCSNCKGKGKIVLYKKKKKITTECKVCNGSGIISANDSDSYWNNLYNSLIEELKECDKSRDSIIRSINNCLNMIDNNPKSC